MATAASLPASRVTRLSLRFSPSLPDLFFAILLATIFGPSQNWQAVLADGDTGWHIRTGDYVLCTGHVPARDLFSFSRAGERWYAWEWLSDVVFAQLHRWQGLEAVAAFAAVAVCMSATVLLCWLLHRGSGLWISLAVTLAAVSASTVHYLARPHLFSLLFLPAALCLLDADLRLPTPAVWCLVPLAALWANLHAGFIAWLGILAVLVAASALGRRCAALRRYGWLAALSALATLANPYGWQLHRHIFSYVSSPWILDHVMEFQSPRIRTENMLMFAVLLLAGVALAARGWRRGQWFWASLTLVWGFAALRSARHIPLFATVAAPVIAAEGAAWWARRAEAAPARSAVRILWQTSLDLGNRRCITPWIAVLGALALLAAPPRPPLADFPASLFPTAAVAHNLDRLAGSAMPHILTSDQWADYLIYRLYPRARVFFDGRSDFYGAAVGDDYQTLLDSGRRWPEVMARYGFQLALLPQDWPLGQILERDPDWRVVYRDRQAVLLARREGGVHP